MQRNKGFTIVELLIVIVIIGILAALVIVAYTGIQNRANDTAVQADLKGVGNKMEFYNADGGAYPTFSQATSGAVGFKATKSAYTVTPTSTANNFLFCVISGTATQRYAVVALSKSGNRFYYSSMEGLKPFVPALAGYVATCNAAGVDTNEAGFWSFWGYNTGAWVSWIKG